MATWRINSKNSGLYGFYSGKNPREAWNAMIREGRNDPDGDMDDHEIERIDDDNNELSCPRCGAKLRWALQEREDEE